MEWFEAHAWQAWLGLGITLGVLEMFSLDLILLMLAVGAGVGMVAALAGLPLVFQALAAVAASAAMLLVVRPSMARRLHRGPELAVGHSKLVGQQGVVLEPVSQQHPGRIKLAGEVWTARPYDDTLTIDQGETVDVLQITGATALVHPVPRLDP